jgi:SAM-dependent methyltransferase
MSTAPGWEAWNGHYKQQMAPVFAWMVRAIDARAGMTVLDLACGPGQPAIPTARLVDKVIATDIAADMLAVCDRLARAEGVTNLELREMDMHVIQLPDASVEAVTCGFALMFSPEPARVLAEIHRVLKPGGRLAVVVWDTPAKNPFFTTLFGTIAKFTELPALAPNAPGPFRLAASGELASLLRAAGFGTISVKSLPVTMCFDSADQHFAMNRDMAAPLKRLATSLPPADLERLRATLADAIAPYAVNGRIELPATPLCGATLKTQ